MTVNNWPERNWTLGLRRQPASHDDGPGDDGPGDDGPGDDGPGNDGPGNDGPGNDGPGNDGTEEYELICRYCGDDPRLGYREVAAELQQIRGPYPLKAGIEAFMEHDQSHESGTLHSSPG